MKVILHSCILIFETRTELDVSSNNIALLPTISQPTKHLNIVYDIFKFVAIQQVSMVIYLRIGNLLSFAVESNIVISYCSKSKTNP